MTSKFFAGVVATTGAFEMVAWGLDPLGVHTALNDGKPMAPTGKLFTCVINGIYVYLAKRLLSPTEGPAATCAISGFVPVFVFGQWIFWWWPYLLGKSAGTLAMQTEHKEQLAALPRLLPARGDNLVPDIEHTLLQPLSLLMLYSTGQLLAKVPGTATNKRWFLGVAGTLTALQSLFIFKGPDGPLKELGPLLAVSQMVGATAWLHSKIGTDRAPARP